MNCAHQADVVVAGAGPVGLSLALALARAGCQVLVLEEDAETAVRSRAPAIWPGTQDVLADLGVVDRFLHDGIAVSSVQVHDADQGRPLLTLPLQHLSDQTHWTKLLILPQSQTERILAAKLEAYRSARLMFSAKVTDG